MSKDEAKQIAKRYALKLKASNFPFRAIYLFGSQAKGGACVSSDIDIAVFSERMSRNFNENEDLLWKLGVSIDPRIEPIGFTEDDLENENDFFVREIKSTGIELKV